MANSVVGAYYPVVSFIHKVDARIKVLIVLATTITLFVVDSFLSFLFLAIFYLVAFLISDLPLGWIYKIIKPVLTILLIAFFFQALFTPGSDILFEWGIIVISKQGLILGLKVIARILILVGFASILSFTTTPIELTDALESLLSFLKFFKLPVSEFALVMAIALRFIPQILSEAQDLMKAQKARGANFESGSLFRRGKALLPLFIPLFLNTYRTAEDLGKAMESRAYRGGKGRTYFKERKLNNKDWLTLIGTAIILIIALLLNNQ